MNWNPAADLKQLEVWHTTEAGSDLPSSITARDLQQTNFPPVKWVVQNLIPEGLTLFAGKPKLGKSWLALQMGLAVATDSEVLGRPVSSGHVLYIALEDNYRRLKQRLAKISGRDE